MSRRIHVRITSNGEITVEAGVVIESGAVLTTVMSARRTLTMLVGLGLIV